MRTRTLLGISLTAIVVTFAVFFAAHAVLDRTFATIEADAARDTQLHPADDRPALVHSTARSDALQVGKRTVDVVIVTLLTQYPPKRG